MPARVRNLLNEALDLPEKARADLSLHPEAEPDVEGAWAKEIDRRLDGLDERAAKSRPWISIKRSLLITQRAHARRKALPRS